MLNRKFRIPIRRHADPKANVLGSLAVLITCFITATAGFAQNKHALVIGNGKYLHAEHLPNPINDATAVAEQLTALGFEVESGIDLRKSAMTDILRKFSRKLNRESVAVFYYAGHGLQIQGRNFLIPVNSDIRKSYEIEYSGIELQMILSALNEAEPLLTVALIDACRDNPFEKRIHGIKRGFQFRGNGLAAMHDIRGTVLSFATEPGSTAVDGYDKHSPYTAALLKYLNVPDLSVQDMLNEIGLTVLTDTNGDQKPWYASSPTTRFCFGGCKARLTDIARVRPIPRRPPFVENMDLKNAIENRNIAVIRRLAKLDAKQEKMLQALFKDYLKFIVSAEPTRSLNGRWKVTILEATNRRGNRVIPSDSWESFTLTMRNKPPARIPK